jgi:hypothetical protein
VPPHRSTRGILIALVLIGLVACSDSSAGQSASVAPAPEPATGAAPWPRPPNTLQLARKAGLKPGTHEYFTFHIHAHLDVFVNGDLEPVPAGLGINIRDPGVQTGEVNGSPVYGGISRCARPCISPLHTHDTTGVIHVEAPRQTDFTLGQLFTEWAVRLDSTCVGGYCESGEFAVYVNGTRFEGDPATIVFADLQEIAIVIGTPPAGVPSTFDPSII